MELTEIVPLLFLGEIIVILALYRWILRDWIINKWEDKLREEGYLVEMLEPVIAEIENSTIESLLEFKQSFIGTLGKMTSEAKKLDPMNNLRKATKEGDWASIILEYVTNKSGLTQALDLDKIQTSPDQVENKSDFGKFK